MTGIVAGQKWERHKITINTGTIVFQSENAGSSALNRISSVTGDITATAGTTIEIYYDGTRWFVQSKYP